MEPAFAAKINDIFVLLNWSNDRILSAYRCDSHEKTVGGTGKNHPKGFAIDVAFMEGKELKELLAACFWKGIRRVLIYQDRKFCHLDDNMNKSETIIIM